MIVRSTKWLLTWELLLLLMFHWINPAKYRGWS